MDPTPDSKLTASDPGTDPAGVNGTPAPTLLGRLDAAMADHPWYPRFLPFIVYLFFLAAGQSLTGAVPVAYPFVYTLQCAVVIWLLWRYRRLLPELTLSFHWLALPVGVGVFVAWVWLGMVIEERDQLASAGLGAFTESLYHWTLHPDAGSGMRQDDGVAFSFVNETARDDSIFLKLGLDENKPVAWIAFTLRLLGMSLVVPLFEELFIRSLMLRGLHRAKESRIGMIQVLQDFPGIGDRIMLTKMAARANEHPPMFEKQFRETPLGQLSVFGVFASTMVFTLSHAPRDYAGCVVCGIAYCLLLWATRHKGLGPVCWAHGITNALIWIYTLHTGDWRFL